MNSSQKFRQFSGALLIYTMIVILWGAWVRISGSGDGCGESWPLCKEEVLPTGDASMWIEFSHRMTSGIFGLLVVFLVFWAFRLFPKSHAIRKISVWALFFTITEALIGAGLVLKGLVGDNQSIFRAWAMALHMVNSLFLTGTLALLYEHAKGLERSPAWPTRRKFVVVVLLIGFLVIATTGAIAALSGTLFPAESLVQGIFDDLNRQNHVLVRLRIWHPIGATAIGLAILSFTASLAFPEGVPGFIKERAKRTLKLVLFAIVFGYMTLLSLSPTWMKLAHLLLAHAVWVSLIWTFFPILRRTT